MDEQQLEPTQTETSPFWTEIETGQNTKASDGSLNNGKPTYQSNNKHEKDARAVGFV